MQLIIVESPTKARTLSKFLGGEFGVEATMGHVKDLPKSKLGVDIEKNFEPQYEIVEKRRGTIENLIRKAKKAKQVLLATDPDREGEAIAEHVRQILVSSIQYPVSRIVFHEITKEAVEEAIENPRDIDKDLVDAQVARRVLDRLVGYKLSPLLWRKVRRGLSAGRVQSVAVRLIVEREREIEKFKSDEYWEIFAKFKDFTAQLINEKIINKNQADGVLADLKKARYVVSDIRKRQIAKNPYPPFTTSTLQQAGARVFGWSSKRTMSIAQRLYEEGLITYHRTDSFNLSSAAVEKARSFIGKTYGENYLPEKARFYKTTSKVAQEAHEAIRPTAVGQITNAKLQMPNDEKKLYDLIWKRFVACQMTASVYDETVILVNAKLYELRASGQILRFDGWRKLFNEVEKENSEFIIHNLELKAGDPLQLIKVDGIQKFTQPPPRYNEASLIKTLEKLGIGRPSTYAPTISTIQVRQYVEKNEGKFFPTPIGVAVNDFLIGNFPDIFEYQFTAEMEDNLDKVANGKLVWVKTIKNFYKPFDKKIKDVTKNSKRVKIEVEKLGKICPECKTGDLVVRTGRFGKFISCSRFPDCKYTEKYLEKTGAKCPDCKTGDVIIKKTGKGRKFFGCSRYPDCKWASWRNPKISESR